MRDASTTMVQTIKRRMVTLCVGPVDCCVMAVLAGVVPTHAVVRPSAVLIAKRHRHPGAGKGMSVERPDLVVGIRARKGIHSHVHDVGNLDRAAFARYVKCGRDGFHTQHGGDERGKDTWWAAGRPTED